MSSLMDFVTSSITPEVSSALGDRFGIPALAARSALETSAATMLTTLATKAHDQALVGRIYSLAAGSGTMAAASSVGSSVSATTSTAPSFLNQLFGSQLPTVESRVAEVSGIPVSAASGIMTAAVPLVLGSLEQRIQGGALSATALGGLLTSELGGLRGFLPAGFAIPGLSGFTAAESSARVAAAAQAEEARGASGWLWPVLIFGALLIAGLVWYFNRTDTNIKVADTATQATTAVANTAQSALTALGSFFKRKLPDGTELNIPENGIENKLIGFIEDSARPVDKTTWFDFDRLLFATGSATLEPASTEQLSNVAAIMKAYPKVDIRIGGYTDNTGDAAANLKLSEDRANNVMAQLVKMGVDPARMDAKGYGVEHPVADNSTEDGRAKNRRISLRVTQK